MSAHQCNHLAFLSVPLSCSPGGRSLKFYVSPSHRTKTQQQIWAPPPDQTCREEEEEEEERGRGEGGGGGRGGEGESGRGERGSTCI